MSEPRSKPSPSLSARELTVKLFASIHGRDLPALTQILASCPNASGVDFARSASIDLLTGLFSPLMFALWHRFPEGAQALLEFGVDPCARMPDGGCAILTAAQTNDLGIFKRLMELGAPIDVVDRKGCSPLHFAAMHLDGAFSSYGDGGVFEFIAALPGQDIDLVNKAGRTPLAVAAEAGGARYVEILLGMGADIQATGPKGCLAPDDTPEDEDGHALDEDGRRIKHPWRIPLDMSPLSRAIQAHDEPCALLLIERGAALDSIDANGDSPLDWAAGCGLDKIASALMDAGADPRATVRRIAMGQGIAAHAPNGASDAIPLISERAAILDQRDALLGSTAKPAIAARKAPKSI